MASVAFDRIEAAVRLEKPDRVPVVPIVDFFSSRYAGITLHEMFFDIEKADAALEKTMEDLGRMDGQSLSYAGLGDLIRINFPVPPRLPGVDGEPPDGMFQFVERSVMEPGEYEDIGRVGAQDWMLGKIARFNPEFATPEKSEAALQRAGSVITKAVASMNSWRAKGFEPLVGANITFTPMERISITLRSFNDFLLDMFRHGDELKAASRPLMEFYKDQGEMVVATSGIRRVFLGGNRTSASFISPRQFEEFALPEWQEMCEHFVAKDITPLLHLDCDWTPFFPYFKSFPRGKCILNLDGTSDIFEAKEVLGGHMCIMGDVPATLLKLGEPEEVDEYCRRLITEVGEDGGFILSSGCTIPPDAKPENVKAMISSVERYGRYGG